MLKDERLKEIETMLQTNGKVEVGNLCRIFNVTEMTIRRDLNDLVARNLAVRSHGGAVAAPDTMLTERPYEIRITRNLREKEAIAREALQFIGDGDRVFFDSSTTVYCLARLISNTQKFLAVTDTLSTAMELNARTSLRVVCLGGELKKRQAPVPAHSLNRCSNPCTSTQFLSVCRVFPKQASFPPPA